MGEEDSGVNPGWHVRTPQGTFDGDPPDRRPNDGTERAVKENRVILIAFLVSLLLHVVLGVGFVLLPKPSYDEALAAPADQEVDVVLVDESSPAETEPELPTAFTSVPDRQASETPPEDPDYLAMHHSLAADNKLGDSDKPSADVEGEFDQVEIRKEDLEGGRADSYSEQPLPETAAGVSPTEEGAPGEEAEKAEGEKLDPAGEWSLPAETRDSAGETAGEGKDATTEEKPDLEDWWGGQAPSVLKEGDQATAGDKGFDFNQAAQGKVESGVAFQQNFSLNTWQWNYAPWMRNFINELHRYWMAPYAYRIGIISGYTVIRIVVEKDGHVSSMEVLETEGHESLHEASEAALKAFQPYAPLPAEFPEENLVITLGLHYPKWRR